MLVQYCEELVAKSVGEWRENDYQNDNKAKLQRKNTSIIYEDLKFALK